MTAVKKGASLPRRPSIGIISRSKMIRFVPSIAYEPTKPLSGRLRWRGLCRPVHLAGRTGPGTWLRSRAGSCRPSLASTLQPGRSGDPTIADWLVVELRPVQLRGRVRRQRAWWSRRTPGPREEPWSRCRGRARLRRCHRSTRSRDTSRTGREGRQGWRPEARARQGHGRSRHGLPSADPARCRQANSPSFEKASSSS